MATFENAPVMKDALTALTKGTGGLITPESTPKPDSGRIIAEKTRQQKEEAKTDAAVGSSSGETTDSSNQDDGLADEKQVALE